MESRYSTLFIVYFLFGWGLTLLYPAATFETSFSYRVMERIMPETHWGLTAFGIGFAYLFAVGRGLLNLQKFILYCAVFYWVSITVSFVVANPIGTANMVYLGIAAHCNLVATEIKRQIVAHKKEAVT